MTTTVPSPTRMHPMARGVLRALPSAADASGSRDRPTPWTTTSRTIWAACGQSWTHRALSSSRTTTIRSAPATPMVFRHSAATAGASPARRGTTLPSASRTTISVPASTTAPPGLPSTRSRRSITASVRTATVRGIR